MTPSPEMIERATKVFEEITLDLCDDDEIKKIIAAALQRVHDEAYHHGVGDALEYALSERDRFRGTKP